MNEKIVLHKIPVPQREWCLKFWGFAIADNTSWFPTGNNLAANISHLQMNWVQQSLK